MQIGSRHRHFRPRIRRNRDTCSIVEFRPVTVDKFHCARAVHCRGAVNPEGKAVFQQRTHFRIGSHRQDHPTCFLIERQRIVTAVLLFGSETHVRKGSYVARATSFRYLNRSFVVRLIPASIIVRPAAYRIIVRIVITEYAARFKAKLRFHIFRFRQKAEVINHVRACRRIGESYDFIIRCVYFFVNGVPALL